MRNVNYPQLQSMFVDWLRLPGQFEKARSYLRDENGFRKLSDMPVEKFDSAYRHAAQQIIEYWRTAPTQEPITLQPICDHCGLTMYRSTDYYMVWDGVWFEAAAGDELLHIGCLETRLGRSLVRSDFADCMVNDGCFGFDVSRFNVPSLVHPTFEIHIRLGRTIAAARHIATRPGWTFDLALANVAYVEAQYRRVSAPWDGLPDHVEALGRKVGKSPDLAKGYRQ